MTADAASKYLVHRAAFREKATRAFFAGDPNAEILIVAMGEIVAMNTLFLSGKNLSTSKERLYLGDLIVSFCRSHFIATDLVTQGELVEAATIIRKQMELMARVQELSAPLDLERIVGRTPNVRHLVAQLGRLYGEYSAIAHSATPVVMRLLGHTAADGRIHTPVYPVFDRDAYVSLNHLGWLCLEFHNSTAKLYADWFPEAVLPEVAPHLEIVFRELSRPQAPRPSTAG